MILILKIANSQYFKGKLNFSLRSLNRAFSPGEIRDILSKLLFNKYQFLFLQSFMPKSSTLDQKLWPSSRGQTETQTDTQRK